jgi:hypothetical protein
LALAPDTSIGAARFQSKTSRLVEQTATTASQLDDFDRLGPAGVQQPDLARQIAVVLDQLQGAKLLQGSDRLLDEGIREMRLHLRAVERRLRVGATRHVPREQERGAKAAVPRLHVPADVVRMEIQQDDRLDVVGPGAGRRKLVQQPTALPEDT